MSNEANANPSAVHPWGTALDLLPEDLEALAARIWFPFPESAKKELREIWEVPRAVLGDAEVAHRRERAVLGLILQPVGLILPDSEPDERDSQFMPRYLEVARDIAAQLKKRKPGRIRKARAMVRMHDAATRAARLCGDEDAARWEKEVRRAGIARFSACLEKAEGMKAANATDKNGNPIRNWSAYLSAMLASKSKPKGGEE